MPVQGYAYVINDPAFQGTAFVSTTKEQAKRYVRSGVAAAAKDRFQYELMFADDDIVD